MGVVYGILHLPILFRKSSSDSDGCILCTLPCLACSSASSTLAKNSCFVISVGSGFVEVSLRAYLSNLAISPSSSAMTLNWRNSSAFICIAFIVSLFSVFVLFFNTAWQAAVITTRCLRLLRIVCALLLICLCVLHISDGGSFQQYHVTVHEPSFQRAIFLGVPVAITHFLLCR